MSTYVIGDIHGCFVELQDLLQLIDFNEKIDRLWFVGDLVNRGPDSLSVLRFVRSINENNPENIVVLGNHEFYLLALAMGYYTHRLSDIFKKILDAPEWSDLFFWLTQQKLTYYSSAFNFLVVHAGIPPHWTLQQAISYGDELEYLLKSDQRAEMIKELFAHYEYPYHDSQAYLSDWFRYRTIFDSLCRIRYCDIETGALDFKANGPPGSQPNHLIPWYEHRLRLENPLGCNIVFGHWSALRGITNQPSVFSIDTGCCWGQALTALRLEDQHRFSVPARIL